MWKIILNCPQNNLRKYPFLLLEPEKLQPLSIPEQSTLYHRAEVFYKQLWRRVSSGQDKGLNNLLPNNVAILDTSVSKQSHCPATPSKLISKPSRASSGQLPVLVTNGVTRFRRQFMTFGFLSQFLLASLTVTVAAAVSIFDSIGPLSVNGPLPLPIINRQCLDATTTHSRVWRLTIWFRYFLTTTSNRGWFLSLHCCLLPKMGQWSPP